jgi:hypothetical protein
MNRELRAMEKAVRVQAGADRPRWGLCGKREHLTKTGCCGPGICDDEDAYVAFSYARNSCHPKHRRYTLCDYHQAEGHSGKWQDCPKCRDDFKDELEMYVHYGANEYHFEKLANPRTHHPTRCSKCGTVIVLGAGGYSHGAEGYLCGACRTAEFPDLPQNGGYVLRPHVKLGGGPG